MGKKRKASGVFGGALGRAKTSTTKRSPGRPAAPPRAVLFVRVRPSTIEALRREAEAREQTLSQAADDLLRRALKLKGK